MSRSLRPSFIERTSRDLMRVFEQSLHAEGISSGRGLLQRLDARAKIIAALLLIISLAASRSIVAIAAVFTMTVVVAVASRVPLRTFAIRAWSQLLALTSLVAIPALVLTPGRAIAALPFGRAITAEGLRNAVLLVFRVETIATLALLLIVSTPWNDILAGLRGLGIPAVVVVIISMTYRQLFVLLQRALDTFTAGRSRLVGELAGRDSRRLAAAAAGALVVRSVRTSEEVYMAMQSRGFSGEVRTLEPLRMRLSDAMAISGAAVIAIAVLWVGRLL